MLSIANNLLFPQSIEDTAEAPRPRPPGPVPQNSPGLSAWAKEEAPGFVVRWIACLLGKVESFSMPVVQKLNCSVERLALALSWFANPDLWFPDVSGFWSLDCLLFVS
jgi:hypothetical protein